MRHKLVQRIVAAYNEYAEKQAPALRQARSSRADGSERDGHRADRRRPERGRPAAGRRMAALRAAGVADGHLAIELVDAERIRELNREHRGRDRPTDVLSFPVDEGGTGCRAARAGRRGDLPRAHPGPERGRRPRRAAPVRLRPRDATTARCSRCRTRSWSGCDPLRLRGARRPAERRQVDARQPDRRRQGRDRLRQAADDAARDPRHRDRRRLAARAGRPARASSARATR